MTTLAPPPGLGERYFAGPVLPDITPAARVVLPAGAPDADWHAVRRTGIGGSDVAAILGLDRYRSPRHIYEAKHGRDEDADSEPARWGRRLEGLIADGVAEEAGLLLAEPPGTLRNTEHTWQLANVDRLALDRHGAVLGPVESKNRSEHQWSDWEEGVPDGPALQTHWYVNVGGWAGGWVGALIGGNRLRWYRIERDQELLDHLTGYLGAWWQRHIVESVPPPVDGSKATTELLAHLWEVRPEAVAEIDFARAVELRERRAALKAQAEAVQERLDQVENEMRNVLGEAEIARVGTRTAWTWKGNGTFRAADFRAEMPELAAAYERHVPQVDTARLAADHPETYRRYRARRLHVPKRGPESE